MTTAPAPTDELTLAELLCDPLLSVSEIEWWVRVLAACGADEPDTDTVTEPEDGDRE